MSIWPTLVVGAGMVGSAIAYGLAQGGERVLALDGAPGDFRASTANFGLVWYQGKGMGMPAYQALTRQSIVAWPEFFDRLRDCVPGIRVDYEQRGGLAYCLGEADFEARRARIAALEAQRPGQPPDVEMVDRRGLEELAPDVPFGPDVVGASFCAIDGHANPLQLLAALHAAIARLDGAVEAGHPVLAIEKDGGGFRVITAKQTFKAGRVVIAAGLSSAVLGKELGLDIPIRPQRGQIIVTQRIGRLLPYPGSGLRQTAEGTIMVGATQEEVGADIGTTTEAAARLSRKLTRLIPALSALQLVRQWAGLRIMSPDGFPVYAQSESHPGLFVATCHSGVTLAAVHAGPLAASLARGALASPFDQFHHRRFDVQARA